MVDAGDLPQLWVYFLVTPQRRMRWKKLYLPFAGLALPSRAGLICPTAAAAPAAAAPAAPATVAAIVAPAATSLLRAGPVFPTSVSSTRD